MRIGRALYIFTNGGLAWLLGSSLANAEDLSFVKTQGAWIDSRPFLDEAKPQTATIEIPLVDNLHNALIQGFNNYDHHLHVHRLQLETGTLDTKIGEGYIGLNNKVYRKADANSTHATRWELFRHAKTYSGKNIKVDLVPERLKKGFRYDPTAPKEGPKTIVFTGPQIKYGLILKNIEPSDDKDSRIASLGSESDMSYFMNAPKADVQYEIGPIAITGPQPGYNFNPAPDPELRKFRLKDYLPSSKVKARLSPRSMPTAAKPIPDQTLVLEQVQGYYRADVQMVNGFQKESVAQTFYLPLFKGFSIAETFDESFKPSNLVVYNDFGNGFSGNVQHDYVLKRYRTGFFYRAGYTNIEIYMNVPESGMNQNWKKLQTWEVNLLSAL